MYSIIPHTESLAFQRLLDDLNHLPDRALSPHSVLRPFAFEEGYRPVNASLWSKHFRGESLDPFVCSVDECDHMEPRDVDVMQMCARCQSAFYCSWSCQRRYASDPLGLTGNIPAPLHILASNVV